MKLVQACCLNCLLDTGQSQTITIRAERIRAVAEQKDDKGPYTVFLADCQRHGLTGHREVAQ